MRRLDGVTEDLATIGIRGWKGRTENREAQRSIVEEAKALRMRGGKWRGRILVFC